MVTAMHLLALALLLGSTSGDTLSGRITDSDGAPVPSATVLISELHRVATSGADGAFRLADVPPGEYTLIVRHVGFAPFARAVAVRGPTTRSEEHTSELQSQSNIVCRLLLEKKKKP